MFLTWLSKDAIFIHWTLITSLWQCPNARSAVGLLWGSLQGFTITWFPEGGGITFTFSSLDLSHTSCCCGSLLMLSAFILTKWLKLTSFPGIHTTHGKLHLLCHTKRWTWWLLPCCSGLSQPIIVQIPFPFLSSRSASSMAKQMTNSEKKPVSLTFVNPIFRSNSLRGSSLHPNQSHVRSSLSTYTAFSNRPPFHLSFFLTKSG